MKKIAIRGGHNFQCPGASAIIDETTEDRKVKDSVIKYLRLDGNEVLDVTPNNCDENTDLNYGVNTANNAKVDIFASIHFNKAYNSYVGAIGSEVWLNPNNPNIVTIGNRILSNLKGLGFINRGCKDGINGEHLFEIHNTNMMSMIVEICFCEATEDVRIYKSVGYDKIGKSVAEGIVGHTIGSIQPVIPIVTPVQPVITPTNTIFDTKSIQIKLNKIKILGANSLPLSTDGIIGNNTNFSINTFKRIMGFAQNSIWDQQCETAYQQIILKPYCDISNQTNKYAVKFIQWLVGTDIDGMWGSGTNMRVGLWQSKNKLVADSKFGNASWAKAIN